MFDDACARMFEANVGKTVAMDVEETGEFKGETEYKPLVVSIDGKEVWKPDPKKKGGGGGGYSQRPEWSYERPEERHATRRSIEGQKALDLATQLVISSSNGSLEDDAKAVVNTARAFADFLQERAGIPMPTSAKSSVSGSRASDGGSGGSSSGKRSKPPSTESGPAPLPLPEAELSSDIVAWIETLTEEYGANKWKLRYKRMFDKPPVDADLTVEEMAQLHAAMREEA
jgi:hypothetical protein